MPASDPRQRTLFGVPDAPVGKPAPVGPAKIDPSFHTLGAAMPPLLRLGTSSWAFPGWSGLVYDRVASDQTLSRHGLAAYAQHPLLRAVGVDRTHYAPMSAPDLAVYAEQVPANFRFLVKAHDHCTLARFPGHPRYGARRGEWNERFLDATYAAEAVVGPTVEGLGKKLGPLLFQFAPQAIHDLGGVQGFADNIHGFLSRLPKGPCYAVEVRNAPLYSPGLADALADVRACPCLLAWPGMPSLDEQARIMRAASAPALVLRWMLHEGMTHETAGAAWAPFDRLHSEDPSTRDAVARLARAAVERGRPALVIVNNKAEGSSPRSIALLVAHMAESAATH